MRRTKKYPLEYEISLIPMYFEATDCHTIRSIAKKKVLDIKTIAEEKPTFNILIRTEGQDFKIMCRVWMDPEEPDPDVISFISENRLLIKLPINTFPEEKLKSGDQIQTSLPLSNFFYDVRVASPLIKLEEILVDIKFEILEIYELKTEFVDPTKCRGIFRE